MKSQLILGNNASLQAEAISQQRGDAYVKRYLSPGDYEWDEKIQAILKSRELTIDQKSEQIAERVKELFNDVPDDQLDVRETNWSAPEIDTGEIYKLVNSYQEDMETDDLWVKEHPEEGVKASKLVIGGDALAKAKEIQTFDSEMQERESKGEHIGKRWERAVHWDYENAKGNGWGWTGIAKEDPDVIDIVYGKMKEFQRELNPPESSSEQPDFIIGGGKL